MVFTIIKLIYSVTMKIRQFFNIILFSLVVTISFSSRADSSYNILILAQEYGHINSFENDALTHTGNRSIALIEYYEQKLGNKVRQLKLSECNIKANKLFCKGEEININEYHGVISRTWDGGENSLKALEILKLCEKKGIYVDNPHKAVETTLFRDKMQDALNKVGVNTPQTFMYNKFNKLDTLQSDINVLTRKFKESKLEKIYPAYVVKRQNGTYESGTEFFKIGQENTIKQLISSILLKGEAVILQEYIRPRVFHLNLKDDHQTSSRMRIIMSKFKKKYKVIGGLIIERDYRWVSTSNVDERTVINPLELVELETKLQFELAKVANFIGINQFGADIIESALDGKFYILGLKDGMLISGPYFEKQKVPEQYIESFNKRLESFIINKNKLKQ